MESKILSNRGIQREDVWTAADSLIADGLRPTIERVRQKIGRGSPNTVSPMLESWFATLAGRLGVNEKNDRPDTIPEELQQAMKNAWEIALAKSREASASEILQVQAHLARDARTLHERETELDQVERVRAVQRQALEASVNSAESMADDALARLSEAQRLARKQEKEIQYSQEKLSVFETDREAARCRNQEIIAGHLQERHKLEERAQLTQHRLLEEIDKARQETKKIDCERETASKQFSAEKMLLEERVRVQEKDQSRLKTLYAAQSADLHALQESLAASNSSSHEIQNLLKAQLEESKSTVARLTQAILNRETRGASSPRSLAPKLKLKRTRNLHKP